MQNATLPFGFNVIGYISSNFGLGIAARNTITSLLHCNYKVAVVDIPVQGRSNQDTTFSYLATDASNPLPYAISLYHLNPIQVETLRIRELAPLWSDRLNVIIPFWELPRIPEQWAQILRKMDIVLAPSHFVEHACACYASKCRVLHYPQTVFLDENSAAPRSKFMLPENEFLFVTSFDIASDLMRKNPIGTIDAYRKAFTTDSSTGLIIKVNKSIATSEFEHYMMRLKKYIGEDPRIKVIDAPMTYSDIISLYSCCDAYVSLHRAEGFGLAPMEAMSLGKPVIATSWSGTTDFMTPANSCPVRYSIVNCDTTLNPSNHPSRLGFQGVWAEPDIEEAARWMRTLSDNQFLCQDIGARARRDMQDRKNQVLTGDIFNIIRKVYANYEDGIYLK